MSLLKFTSFGGVVPRLAKRDIPDDKAQIANNLAPDTNEFRPLMGHSAPVVLANMTPSQTCKTLFRYPMKVGQPLYGTDLLASVVRSPISSDRLDRAYAAALYGEAEAPPVVLAADGSTNAPIPKTSLRLLGVKPPTKPLTLTKALHNTNFVSTTTADSFRNGLTAKIKEVLLTIRTTEWASAGGVGANLGHSTDTGMVTRSVTKMVDVGPPAVTTTVDVTFQGAAKFFGISPSTSAAKAALATILKPGTTEQALTTTEINYIVDSMVRFFVHPTTTEIPGIKTVYDRYTMMYDGLENVFTVQMPGNPYADPTKHVDNLAALATEITRLYEDAWGVHLDSVLAEYIMASVAPNLPRGEAPIPTPRFYTYTFVNDRDEESRPYYPEDATGDLPTIEVDQSEKVVVRIPDLPLEGISANYNINRWRIYRSATGTTAAEFMFVTELPITTSVFDDTLPTEKLNEPLSTKEWEPPPVIDGKNLRHLVNMPGGFLAGFIDNTVYFSEPNVPYAWPVAYAVPMRANIVALGVFGVTLVVLTEAGPVYMSGNAPDAMSAVVIESQEVCQSPRSVVQVTGGVLFASQNGMCIATQGGVKVITDQLVTRSEWRLAGPDGLVCEEYDGNVFLSHVGFAGMFALHVPTMKLTVVTTPVTALYADVATGDLYAAQKQTGQTPTHVNLFAGSEPMEAKWRSKRIVMEKETGFAWMRVEGEQTATQSCAVDIFGYYIDASGVEVCDHIKTERVTYDGDVMTSATVADTRPFRVGTGRYKDFEVEIRGKCRITSVVLASSTAELQGVN